MGGKTIATDFSGSTDFTRPSNSRARAVQDGRSRRGDYMYGGGQWWAEPDHDAAVSAMRRAAITRRTSRACHCARRDIMRDYSFAAIGR
jgi:hypothetical protein